MLDFWSRHRHPELWPLHLEERYLDVALQRLLAPASSVVDVGCHVGSFLAKVVRISPLGSHVAVEPSPFKSQLLKNKFVSSAVHACAVSDRPGRAVFEENLQRPGCSKFASSGQADSTKKYYEVDVSTIDGLLDRSQKIALIKLDIEGAELKALRGSTATILEHRPVIIFECGPEKGYEDGRDGRLALYDFMSVDMKYHIYTFSDYIAGKGEMDRREFMKTGVYPFTCFNFLALPQAL